MDAENHRKKFRHEATCPICLLYFSVPVTLDCGHSFCETCIRSSWEVSETCPYCRTEVRHIFHPSYSLSSLVQIVSDWDLSAEREAWAWAPECERHHRPLELFCKDDQAPLCVECDRSQEHGGHSVVPVEEAAQEYKDQISSCLEILQKERERNLAYKTNIDNTKRTLMNELESEKETLDELVQLIDFLREENDPLLEADKLEEEIIIKAELYQARLSEELCSLNRIIQEMEEKRQQPANELLQNVGSTLQRYEERKLFEIPRGFLTALEWKVREYSDKILFFKSVVKQFKDTVENECLLQEANITLNPDTAHPILILAKDRRSVRLGDACQDVPDKPERFDCLTVVLGCEEFTAGRHSWEVTVGGAELWAVGVARKSVQRKSHFNISSEEGIWAVEKQSVGYRALDHHCPPMSVELKRIRVVLNYPGQRVAFYDADRASPIYSFSDASFCGEPLIPFFFLGDTGPLTLFP